jgi:hypothetical protein
MSWFGLVKTSWKIKVVGMRKRRSTTAPNRVKYPEITVMLPTSSQKIAPTRKKLV